MNSIVSRQYGGNQNTIQRFMSVKKWTDASWALVISYVGFLIIFTCTCLCGVLSFAKYYDCDLLTSKQVEKPEQILPFYVMDILGSLPGLPGLFVALVCK